MLSNLQKYITCSDSPEATGLPTCFSLSIKSSSFTRVGWKQKKRTSATLVDPQYNMRYSGVIIHLQDFRGDILIKDSIFTSNGVQYSDCKAANDYTLGITSSMYTKYTGRTYLQMRSVISSSLTMNSLRIWLQGLQF